MLQIPVIQILVKHSQIVSEVKECLHRIAFWQRTTTDMIDFTLWYAVYLAPHQTQAPAQIYLFIVCEKTTVKRSGIPIVLGTYHHAGTCSPQHFLLVIILSVVPLHSLKDTPPAERITIFVQKATTGTSIFKTVLIVFCQQFRLTGCHLRMTVHKLDERS